MQQHEIDSIIELELLYSLVHEKYIRQGPDEHLKNPSLSLYAPRISYFISMKCSVIAMQYVHLTLENPKNLLYRINFISWRMTGLGMIGYLYMLLCAVAACMLFIDCFNGKSHQKTHATRPK